MSNPPPILPSTSPVPPVAAKTSKLAIASLVCALIPLVPITTVAALILSVKAKKSIRESQGALTGSGLATSGLIVSLSMAVVLLIIAALAALATPAILKQRKLAEMTRAMSNSRQVYLCIMDFESDMGSFPDDQTAAQLPDPALYRGTTSNPYLAQLIAGGYMTTETIFPTDPKTREQADNVINPPTEILKQGENGWTYLLVDDKSENPSIRGLSTSDQGDIPFLMAPIVDANGTIDPKPFDGKGVYLRIDGSARREPLSPGGSTPFDDFPWTSDFRPVVKLPK